MTRIAVATLVAFMMFATSGSAAWFARLDSGDRLAITGIATDKDGVSSTVTLTCADGRFAAQFWAHHSISYLKSLSHSTVGALRRKPLRSFQVAIVRVASTLTVIQGLDGDDDHHYRSISDDEGVILVAKDVDRSSRHIVETANSGNYGCV